LLSSESNEQKLAQINYEQTCQAIILNLLGDLRKQYVEGNRDEAASKHFTQGVRLMRATISALKLGPNWKRMADLRKQLDELQSEVGKEKAGREQ
jgi:inorganic triphosphatase YgiF